MLTDEQRNGMIDPAYRWPNKVVPFYIDPVFSEYYNTELQSGMRGVEGHIHALRLLRYLQYNLKVEWTN